MSEIPQLKQIVEGAILAADRPLSIDQMIQLFEREQPSRAEVRDVLREIGEACEGKGYELKEVASGWRFQVRSEYSEWVGRLWEEKPPRYSRALLETLALIAYKQPITRGDIEEIRGVSVSTNIIRSLMEREWIRVVGHRDVPGRPAIYATTKTFLDYFNLSSLDELPTLSEIKDLDKLNPELALEEEEMPEARTLELDDGEGAEAQQVDEQDDDFDLDDVTSQVNQIQDNIRNLFAEEEADDIDLDDEDDELDDRAASETREETADSSTPAEAPANEDSGAPEPAEQSAGDGDDDESSAEQSDDSEDSYHNGNDEAGDDDADDDGDDIDRQRSW